MPASRSSSLPNDVPRHSLLVRITHWLTALACLALIVSGLEIVVSHPRFYLGETGNVNEKPLFTLPIPASRDTVPTGYNYVMPDQNGWSRYLHFQAAWLLLFSGIAYVGYGLISGHFRRNLWPEAGLRSWRDCGHLLGSYLRGKFRSSSSGGSYNALQRVAYLSVVFVLFPLLILSGLVLSPAFNAAVPWLAPLVGGHQTARTLHFFLTWALVGFLAGHVFMVAVTGFRQRMRAMTIGSSAKPTCTVALPTQAVEEHV